MCFFHLILKVLLEKIVVEKVFKRRRAKLIGQTQKFGLAINHPLLYQERDPTNLALLDEMVKIFCSSLSPLKGVRLESTSRD